MLLSNPASLVDVVSLSRPPSQERAVSCLPREFVFSMPPVQCVHHWMSTLVLVLVRKPNHTELKPRFFPKTETVPTDLGQCDTITTLVMRHVLHFLFLWDFLRISEMLRRIRVSHLPFFWDSQRNSENLREIKSAKRAYDLVFSSNVHYTKMSNSMHSAHLLIKCHWAGHHRLNSSSSPGYTAHNWPIPAAMINDSYTSTDNVSLQIIITIQMQTEDSAKKCKYKNQAEQ